MEPRVGLGVPSLNRRSVSPRPAAEAEALYLRWVGVTRDAGVGAAAPAPVAHRGGLPGRPVIALHDHN